MVPPVRVGRGRGKAAAGAGLRRVVSGAALVVESGRVHAVGAPGQGGDAHQDPEQRRLLRPVRRYLVISIFASVLDI